MPWNHSATNCVHCGRVGARTMGPAGMSHEPCLPPQFRRDRRRKTAREPQAGMAGNRRPEPRRRQPTTRCADAATTTREGDGQAERCARAAGGGDVRILQRHGPCGCVQRRRVFVSPRPSNTVFRVFPGQGQSPNRRPGGRAMSDVPDHTCSGFFTGANECEVCSVKHCPYADPRHFRRGGCPACTQEVAP